MKQLVIGLGVLTLVGCAGNTSPTSVIPALSIRVTPNPVVIGQSVNFRIAAQGVTTPVNLALFVETPSGQVDQVMPNRLPGGTPVLHPGHTLTYPAAGAPYTLMADGPAGEHRMALYASPTPIEFSSISADADDSAMFATVRFQGKGGLDRVIATLSSTTNGMAAATTQEVTAPP